MLKRFVFYLLIFYSVSSLAQIQSGGLPYSMQKKVLLKPEKSVPLIQIPVPDVLTAKTEDKILDTIKSLPWRFGINIPVEINIFTQSVIDTVENQIIRRTGIYCPGAKTINLTFSQFVLPAHGKLYIYNEDKSQILGAFTDANNQEDSIFATTLLSGETIILEYAEPIETDFHTRLVVSTVTYGYRTVTDFFKSFGASGNCNVNVACQQGSGWEAQRKSVCMLVSGSNGFCTGSLVNNTKQDATPYILTANHCYSNPSSVVVWFNWESTTCANPVTSPSYKSMSGAVLRAKSQKSDFCLYQMLQSVPDDYDLYLSGWNRTYFEYITPPVYTIHHPKGDIKKISWSDNETTLTSYVQNEIPGDSSHFRITQWSNGTTTESGSSGAPLFDNQKHIIGQLHGGYASCTNIASDWYGSFCSSWEGLGSPDSRLKDWLDPLNSGVNILDGYAPQWHVYQLDMQLDDIVEPSEQYCSAKSISPACLIRNTGILQIQTATVSCTIGSNLQQIHWEGILNTGETQFITFDNITIDNDEELSVSCSVSEPNGQNDEHPENDSKLKNVSVHSKYVVPFSEDFEQQTFPPECWTQEYIYGWTSWKKSQGGYNGQPSGAYSGTNNALLQSLTNFGYQSKLISPPLFLIFVVNPVLHFSHAQTERSGIHDELRVYYKNGAEDQWILLSEYTTATPEWTSESISIPTVSAQCYIAFDGTLKGGNGICLDKIEITGDNAGMIESLRSKMSVYPNPAKNIISLVNYPFETEYITVSDPMGSILLKVQNKDLATPITLNVSELKNGVYFLKCYCKSGSISSKFLIIR